MSIVLKASCEIVVKVPTNSEELKARFISKMELLPGIVMAVILTVVQGRGCLTIILNMSDEVSVSLPIVDLEDCEIETNTIQVDTFVTQGAVTWEDRLRELQKRIWTDHLNNQERRAIMNICEYSNDIFKLLGNKLATMTAIEHAIPTPGIDPCRRIASRNNQIPKALNGELQEIIDQMLCDYIIRHSNSLWNWPIILVKQKEDASKKEKWWLVVDFHHLNEVVVGDHLFKSKLLTRNSKLRMYKTLVRPAVTCACETWVLKENIKTKLRVFERKVLRRIYGHTKEKDGTWWIKSNEELNRLTGNKNIINYIKAQRLAWFGHVHRMPDNSRVKKSI